MRYSQAEKMEVIRMVEKSSLSVQKTLSELDINPLFVYDENQGVKVIDGRITLKV